MKRRKVKSEAILKLAESKLPNLYSSLMVQEVGNAVLESLVEMYVCGDVVDFGLGNSYLKLRKNNPNFSPTKTHSIVFRGDVNREIADPLIEKSLDNPSLYEMLYTRRGVEDSKD